MALTGSISGNQPGQTFGGGDQNVKTEASRIGNQQTSMRRTKSKSFGGNPPSIDRIYDPEKAPFKKAAPAIRISNDSWVAIEPVQTFLEGVLNFMDGLGNDKNYVAPEF